MSKDQVLLSGIGIALAAALLLLGVPALSGAAAPTQSQCEDAWEDSDADDSCDNEYIVVEDEKCRVSASCLTEDPWDSRATTILTSLANVDDLENCSGSLQVGSCS